MVFCNQFLMIFCVFEGFAPTKPKNPVKYADFDGIFLIIYVVFRDLSVLKSVSTSIFTGILF